MKSRYGWAVAVASIALWVLAPVSWTQMVHESTLLSILHGQQAAQAEDWDPGSSFWTAVVSGDGGVSISGCDSTPTPTPVTPSGGGENLTPAAPSTGQPGLQATFRLCGTADPQTQRAIEQLIAGRGYSATLVSRSDGCADLTITVSPNSGVGSAGQQSTNLAVSSGSGGTISVQIVSENGATHVAIGSGN